MTSDPRPEGTLVFHQAALGDFVLTWPLLRRLPGPVRVVAPWSHATLAAAALPGVGGVSIEQFEFTRMHSPGGPSTLSPAVRELFASAACVVGFVGGCTGVWAANADRLLGHAERVLLDPRPPEGFAGHVTAWHAGAVGARIPLAAEATPAPADPAGSGEVLLHPGSGGVMKCWPRARFAALAERLVAGGRRVGFVVGEAEAERWDADAFEELRVDGVGLTRIRDLAELVEKIRRCRVYVGNDAGPTHLAAQLGVPTLALFGPSDPVRFRPVGPRVRVLAPPVPTAMRWLGVEAVRDQIASF
ncbi:glycosyltransferase family 9 protein [Phycisphaera mikurensis]|uniref:Putative glycosyltransferase n=1 Tax=Phycisphaera mikurensis (strain NBRC 102666 / KCTC 22515 / FYK2301M01) TaxID=1142394 RepID=I0IGF9_PHYMF|nr:glycosyltransferase family 9 protein [Phycisphaera mikurensis]MBB6442970.1 hypothetical protein [Phycisphaera mikurensis]BAM04347.1 putative glycosyltransferase [Phycisphaera mikurensis NBRC 102666]